MTAGCIRGIWQCKEIKCILIKLAPSPTFGFLKLYKEYIVYMCMCILLSKVKFCFYSYIGVFFTASAIKAVDQGPQMCAVLKYCKYLYKKKNQCERKK